MPEILTLICSPNTFLKPNFTTFHVWFLLLGIACGICCGITYTFKVSIMLNAHKKSTFLKRKSLHYNLSLYPIINEIVSLWIIQACTSMVVSKKKISEIWKQYRIVLFYKTIFIMAMSMSIGIPVKRTRCQTGATYCPKQHNFTDIFLFFFNLLIYT